MAGRGSRSATIGSTLRLHGHHAPRHTSGWTWPTRPCGSGTCTVVGVRPRAAASCSTARPSIPGGGGQPPDHGVLLWQGVQTRIVGTRKGDDLYLIPAEGDPVPPPGTAVARRDRGRAAQHADAYPLRAARAVRRGVPRLRRAGHRRQHGAGRGPDGLQPARGPAGFKGTLEERSTPRSPPTGRSRYGSCPAPRRWPCPTSSGPRPSSSPPTSRRSASSTSSGLDVQADGGTHVASTGQIGRVQVVKVESKGKQNRRVRIRLVGDPPFRTDPPLLDRPACAGRPGRARAPGGVRLRRSAGGVEPGPRAVEPALADRRRAARRAPTAPATPPASRRRPPAARTTVGQLGAGLLVAELLVDGFRRSLSVRPQPPSTVAVSSPSASRTRSASPRPTRRRRADHGAVGPLHDRVAALQGRRRRQSAQPGQGVRAGRRRPRSSRCGQRSGAPGRAARSPRRPARRPSVCGSGQHRPGAQRVEPAAARGRAGCRPPASRRAPRAADQPQLLGEVGHDPLGGVGRGGGAHVGDEVEQRGVRSRGRSR